MLINKLLTYIPGYRITLVTLKNGKPVKYQPFIDGWLQNNHAWGRPVDVLQLADGSMLISDDTGGTLWRMTLSGRPPLL